MTTNIRFKTHFIQDEILLEDESSPIQYMDSCDNRKLIKSCINSFLNRRGGRIYIGINDVHLVKGIQLTMKKRDELKLGLYGLLENFQPPIKNKELVHIQFVPIVNPRNNGETIPGLFIIKIIVKQGDPLFIYSTSSVDFDVYLRNDAQSVRLNVEEITDQIRNRKKSPEAKVPDSEFNDPKPEPLRDIIIGNEKQMQITESKTPEESKDNSVQSQKAKYSTEIEPKTNHLDLSQAKTQKETLTPKKSKKQGKKEKIQTDPIQQLLRDLEGFGKFSQGQSQTLITYQNQPSVSHQQIRLANC